LRSRVSRDHVAQHRNCLVGLALHRVPTAERGLEIERDFVEATAIYGWLAILDIGDCLIHPTGGVALRGRHVELRQPRMLDGLGGFDEFLCPRDGFVLLAAQTEDRGVDRDCGCCVEITMVRGPPKRGAKIRQFDRQPRVGLALSGTVPQYVYIGFALGEVAGVGSTHCVGFTCLHKLLFSELADGLQHRKPCRFKCPVHNQKRFADKGIEQIQCDEVVDRASDSTRTGKVEAPSEH
jgi:hypothetical protein